MQVEKKLDTYQAYLESKGYNQANLEIILREKVDAFSEFEFGGKIIFPSKYEAFVPMGNPPPFMVGYGYEDDRAYGMVFVSQDTAVNLKLAGELNKVENPIFFMHTIKEVMSKILIETRDEIDVLEEDYNETSIDPKFMDFVNITGIDSILYAVFTNSKVLILGELDEAVELIRILLLLLPDEFRSKSGFTINMPYIDDNVINFSVLENIPTIELAKEVDYYLGLEIPVVNLYEKTCYGDFSSNYTRQIIEMIKADNHTENASGLVRKIFDLALEVIEGETAQQFAERNNIGYDDADLILDIIRNGGGY